MSKQHYVIVVADDDPGINELLNITLTDAGYQVHSCFSGDEAARIIQRIQPDVAVVDMQMETRDAGLRLLQALRQDPHTMRLSVVICSADTIFLDATRESIVELGATVLPKPFYLDEVLQTVESLLAPRPMTVAVNSALFEHARQRLAARGYEVISDDHGYSVLSATDPVDVSRARHIDDLIDLADLWDWAHGRQLKQSV
jgi:CheY-like chemotaxis protein